MKKTLALFLVLLISVSVVTGCVKKTSPLESAFDSLGSSLESAFDSLGTSLESALDSAVGATSDPNEQLDPNNAPSVGGSGITTDALINETWDWMLPMSYSEESKLTYEQFVERLGDEGELHDTYDDKAAYRWRDPNGGVMLITFVLAENGSYCYDQMSRSGTNPEAAASDNGDDFSLIGTWSISSAIDTDGTTYTADELISFGMTAEIVLNEDKTVMCDFAGEIYTGTWSLDDDFDDLLILTLIDENGDEDELLFDIVGDTLKLDDDGSITVFSKK